MSKAVILLGCEGWIFFRDRPQGVRHSEVFASSHTLIPYSTPNENIPKTTPEVLGHHLSKVGGLGVSPFFKASSVYHLKENPCSAFWVCPYLGKRNDHSVKQHTIDGSELRRSPVEEVGSENHHLCVRVFYIPAVGFLKHQQ